jgi:hypothetical protein
MTDMMTIFLAGVEEIAKNMKEHANSNPAKLSHDKDLEQKVEKLSAKVDKLMGMLEGKLEDGLNTDIVRSKRMMDIKQRISTVIREHPEGIRPPQIAKIIGTRVQNLYPHLKYAVQQNQIVKDESGMYLPLEITVVK